MLHSLIQFDQFLTKVIYSLHGQSTLLDAFGFFVSTYLIILIAFICFIWAIVGKRHWILVTFLLAGGLSQLGKVAIASFYFRNRPTVSYLFDQIPYNASFPSGHTAGAFALAFTVLLLTKWKSPFGWVLVGLGFLVAFGRVFEGLHYVSDTVGGFVVGFIAAWIGVKGVGKIKVQNSNFKSSSQLKV